MTAGAARPLHGASELRRAFDAAFAKPPGVDQVEAEGLIRVRLGGDPYAIRLTEIAAFAAGQKIASLPGAPPELLGVTGFRSRIIPVYALRGFLGYPPAAAPRWLVIGRSEDEVAYAFDEFEGHLTIRAGDAAPFEAGAGAGTFVRETVRDGGTARPILSIPLVLEAIKLKLR